MSSTRLAEDMGRGEHDIIVSTKENDLDGVKDAIREDAYCVNQQDEKFGYTALHIAAAWGAEEILDYILSCDHLDLSIRDKSGSTAIDSAIGCGFHEFAERMYRVAYPKVMGSDDDPFPPKGTSGPKLVP